MKITVVCTGNICRSPMGEVMLRSAIATAELNDETGTGISTVDINSCGLGGWHIGDNADSRALSQLQRDGYDGSAHRAAQFGEQHANADLFLAMDRSHVRGLTSLGVPAEKIRLFRSFDPNSPEGAEVDDPYYGTQEDFARVSQEITAALPGIVEYCKQH